MVFSSDGRFAYVPNYWGNSVAQYFVGADGTLRPMSPATVSSGGDGPATLALDTDGKNIYVGNLRSKSIAAFKVNTDGTLADTPFAVVNAAARPYHLIAH
jgi:DNA-binding beta-propeller fold protein YncE